MKLSNSLPYIFLMVLFIQSSCGVSQKSSKSKKEEKKPEWVMSRPVDRNYYQGIGVAMVNNYTQGHAEEAKKKAMNDLISEISVKVKTTSLMQQVERNEELNSMYQNLTKVTAENDIEGYELVASWGDEKEYWVYYRLSKELYNRNKQRKLDRAKNIGIQYYESGRTALASGDVGRAYEDYIKGLAALKEYIDAELMIQTDKGQEYLVDALMYELIELNRAMKIESNVSSLKVHIAKSVDQDIQIGVSYQSRPVGIALKPFFSTGSGEVPNSITTGSDGKATFRIQRVTGGQNQQVLEVGPDVEGMTAEGEGVDLMARLIRIKTGVPSVKINIEAQKISAYLESDVLVFGQKASNSSVYSEVKNKLSAEAFVFTESKANAEVVIKVTSHARKGEEIPLKNKTLYTAYVNFFITVTNAQNGNQVYYKGFTDEKGSRAGDFDKARSAADESVMERFEKELLPEIGNLDL